MGVCPETKWVEGSNYVDVNFKVDERTGRVVMMGALDNLVKGAAGQAVQNMNLLFGFDRGRRASIWYRCSRKQNKKIKRSYNMGRTMQFEIREMTIDDFAGGT